MSPTQSKRLRTFAIVLIVLLFVQYALGMDVNFASPPSLPAFSISDSNAFNAALSAVGIVAQLHSILGFAIWLVAVVNLVLAIRCGVRAVQLLGWLTFLTVTLGGIGGTLFVSSGFNNDDFSKMMAGVFLLSYTSAFLGLYALKG